MAVEGGVLHTVVITMQGDEVKVVKREQALRLACFGGTFEEIMGRLAVGRTVRLTERKFAEFREWEEEN